MIVRKRKPHFRNIPTIIYIVGEGYTELSYFTRLQEELKSKGYQDKVLIKPYKARKQNANAVVEYANIYCYQQLFNYDKELRNKTKIYCVFDKDSNTKEQIKEAIKIAEKINAEIIFSNPCFELWFYTHYKHNITRISKDTLKNFLCKRENLGENFKAQSNNNYGRLRDKIVTAKINSKKIHKEEYKFEDEGNPSTDVFKIIEYVEKIINEKL